MEMACNEKKMATFFQVLPVCCREVAKTGYIQFFLREIPQYYFSRCCYSNFMLEKKVLCQIFEQF